MPDLNQIEALTPLEAKVLIALRAEYPRKLRFETVPAQEAACSLDSRGLAAAYTDEAYSMGVIFAAITDAGIRALHSKEQL